MTDKSYPKEKAAELAKRFDFDYWDGDRKICYGVIIILKVDGKK